MLEIQDLGLQTNVDVLKRFVDLQGKRVIDAGCGSLTFSRLLAECGASVLAIDPDVEQAKLNRSLDKRDGLGRIEFIESGAESIPVDDSSYDGIFFSYSLHHIPANLFEAVFAEVDRVLIDSGFLYIIEPIACPLNDVMKLFHDEDLERAAAWEAIGSLAAPRFSEVRAVEYHSFVTYESPEHFVDHFGSRSFNPDYTYDDVATEEVRAAFLARAKRTELGYEFLSPKRAVYLAR